MKFFVTIAFVLAIAAVSNASVSKIVEPVLRTVVPLTNGLDNGLQLAAPQIQVGLNDAGAGLNSATCGVGDIAQHTLSGLGETADDLPTALLGLLDHLDHAGIVGKLLGSLLGCSHRRHH